MSFFSNRMELHKKINKKKKEKERNRRIFGLPHQPKLTSSPSLFFLKHSTTFWLSFKTAKIHFLLLLLLSPFASPLSLFLCSCQLTKLSKMVSLPFLFWTHDSLFYKPPLPPPLPPLFSSYLRAQKKLITIFFKGNEIDQPFLFFGPSFRSFVLPWPKKRPTFLASKSSC